MIGTMLRRRIQLPSLSDQIVASVESPAPAEEPEFNGSSKVVSTGSTLLDLAISGGRFPHGGIPGGILVEIFGPTGCGKTSLLCELAGNVQRAGGQVLFRDPEARLNNQFARIFGFKVEDVDYAMPDTVVQLFEPLRKWVPENEEAVHAIFADSLAALSTELEMDKGDKMGQRRAKDFSEQCRLICRHLQAHNLLMVCSNQVRQNVDAGPFSEKYTTPGGLAIGFYASLRLRCHSPMKVEDKKPFGGGEVKRVIGVTTRIEVYKSSVWKPHRDASVTILYDYGVDDIRDCLEFLKKSTGASKYNLGDLSLGVSLNRAIRHVEEDGLHDSLKAHTVALWNEIEDKFKSTRQEKRR